ncbi:HisA/HisF-related TIM barrel protein [Legionella hackeliae]|uniref:Putative imidazole glycerol phosphate synthase subunit hisF2 n=1 Tax=Legionella hackeliae TaxID=449 RepID=A0A0A8UNB4_LEGHA|nr:HisA/HisF-related TIM barrel protein [Legionella hackeliae]KTD08800.1 putative imidazole glycerol phosphate synthase,cyclase subunit (HisF) [Legionella hackeliae]CEK10228.1 putative imidazole glycerol phosphate synthase subunit hisF2 [Legionella hackeliae]STX46957.1 putative imidazole glycerol phosphate synthase,cyclase subunit (HisF) [Legionella hackeliae]
MLKKRLIFTLIYNDQHYMLSRNFRMQRVGDIQWINKNYNFSHIATSLDELIVLDASETKDIYEFSNQLKKLVDMCFIPVAAGGGIRILSDAELLLNSGADKLVVNTILFTDPSLVKQLVEIYGNQCIIASIDFKLINNTPVIFIHNGSEKLEVDFVDYLHQITELGVGELYLNSMDKDGTGQGYALEIFDHIPDTVTIPIIMAGGAGNHHHLFEGITKPNVQAVATANLFNFIGNGLPFAREQLRIAGVPLSCWDGKEISSLKNYFGEANVS